MESRDFSMRCQHFKCVNSSISRAWHILPLPCVCSHFFLQRFASFLFTELSPVGVRLFLGILFFLLASFFFFIEVQFSYSLQLLICFLLKEIYHCAHICWKCSCIC